MLKKIFDKIASAFVTVIGKIHWAPSNTLSEGEKKKIHDLLVPNYYIILTHKNNHLSTFFVGLGNFLLTGKWGYWGHVLMNLEDEVHSDSDFRLIEAVGTGVTYSPFDSVFEVNGVALLKPKNMGLDKWTAVMDKAMTEIGKPYDTLFDLKNDQALSCVELVRDALMGEPDYTKNFAHFEAMIQTRKNLTPDMFYDCDDFELVFEIRR
jgi:hypothetical protein